MLFPSVKQAREVQGKRGKREIKAAGKARSED